MLITLKPGCYVLTCEAQVLDALLKEVCAALLETDVNVKLVATLRQKVKAKVKASFEAGADKGKEINRKNIVQKVSSRKPEIYTFADIESRLSSMSSSNWWILGWNRISPRRVNPMLSWLSVFRCASSYIKCEGCIAERDIG